jgi:hypothetical protein
MGGYSYLGNTSMLALFLAPNVTQAESNAIIIPFFESVNNALLVIHW